MTFPLAWTEKQKFVYEAQRNLLTKTKTKAHNFWSQRFGGIWTAVRRDLCSVRVKFSNQALSLSLSVSLTPTEHTVGAFGRIHQKRSSRAVWLESLCCAPPAPSSQFWAHAPRSFACHAQVLHIFPLLFSLFFFLSFCQNFPRQLKEMSSGQNGRDIINLTSASFSRASLALLPLPFLASWVMCGFSCSLYIFKLSSMRIYFHFGSKYLCEQHRKFRT